MEATKALLTKPYVTGISYDGDLTTHPLLALPSILEEIPFRKEESSIS
jgi:hypothetical protein